VQMRERLLSAALELFAANGFGETTIDQIAERADVARQTVLNHFPRKTDFARAWGQERREQLARSAPAWWGMSRRGRWRTVISPPPPR